MKVLFRNRKIVLKFFLCNMCFIFFFHIFYCFHMFPPPLPSPPETVPSFKLLLMLKSIMYFLQTFILIYLLSINVLIVYAFAWFVKHTCCMYLYVHITHSNINTYFCVCLASYAFAKILIIQTYLFVVNKRLMIADVRCSFKKKNHFPVNLIYA